MALLREGLSNPQIADRLGISLDGAKYHVGEIISKLGVSSRFEAARWQPEPERWRGIGVLLGMPRPHVRSVAAPVAASLIAAAGVAVVLLAWGVFRTRTASQSWSLDYVSPQPTQAVATAGPSLQPQLAMPAGGIAAITVVSENEAWAAGTGGVFRSVDGGRSWLLAYVSPQPLSGIAAAPDGRHGWAVGGLGTILRTDDGAETWHVQPAATKVNLSEIAVLDSDTALAAGMGSGYSDVQGPTAHTFLRTDDGGSSWREMRLGDGAGVVAINFLNDRQHGWMAAESCGPNASPNGNLACGNPEHTLLRSDDAGKSWQVVAKGVLVSRIQFVDEQVGWAVGSTCGDNSCLSAFVRTADGGATWQTVHTPAPTSFFAFDAQTANINEPTCGAWISESQRICMSWRTEDGGLTWTQLTGPSVYSTRALSFFDHLHGVSPDAQPRWTQDGGNTWQDADFPTIMGSGAIDFVDDEHGWFAASKLLRTSDAGATWVPVSDKSFTALTFISASEGWGTTTSPRNGPLHLTLWHTTDGGTSWQEQYGMNVDVNRLPRIWFTTPSDGWLLFESDGRALHTRDGGVTWYEQALPTTKSPDADGANEGLAVFVGASDGWVAVPGGHVYVTADGGDHWTGAGDFGKDVCYVSDISSVSALVVRVVAAGCGGGRALYQTYDGGHEWSAASLDASIHAVTFFGSQVGRAIANVCDQEGCSSSSVMRTADGGATWTSDEAALPVASVSTFTSPEHVWLESVQPGSWTTFSQRLYHYMLP